MGEDEVLEPTTPPKKVKKERSEDSLGKEPYPVQKKEVGIEATEER